MGLHERAVRGVAWSAVQNWGSRAINLLGVLHAMFYFNSAVILAAGKPSWRLIINALNAVCNVVAFILVVQWGNIAVAAAYVIRGYVFASIPMWAVRKLVGMEWSTYLRTYGAIARFSH